MRSAMKLLARWAWVAVLGTALALSWWSLDAFARRYGMPPALAAMVSATFDGAALVAADLAMRRAAVADSALAVKVLMLGAVGLSAWLNYRARDAAPLPGCGTGALREPVSNRRLALRVAAAQPAPDQAARAGPGG